MRCPRTAVLLAAAAVCLCGGAPVTAATPQAPAPYRNFIQYDVGQELGFGSIGRRVAADDAGDGVPVEDSGPVVTADVVANLRREASMGKKDSLYFLGILNFYGDGVPQDVQAAVSLFRRAAEAGHVDAMVNLGLIMSGAVHPGEPTAADSSGGSDATGAAAWLRRAASTGHADAQWMLGRMYYDGRLGPSKYAEALRLFQDSAAQGNAQGQYHAGLMREYGLGAPQDMSAAATMYKAAAESNHLEAMYNLGLLYAYGRGKPKDYSHAILLFEKASAADHGPSCIMLATMAIYGNGMDIDYQVALAWFKRALASGDERVEDVARKGVTELTALLKRSEEQAEEVRRRQRTDGTGTPAGAPERLPDVRMPRTREEMRANKRIARAVGDAQARARASRKPTKKKKKEAQAVQNGDEVVMPAAPATEPTVSDDMQARWDAEVRRREAAAAAAAAKGVQVNVAPDGSVA